MMPHGFMPPKKTCFQFFSPNNSAGSAMLFAREARPRCEVNRAAKSKTASRIARTTWGFRQSDDGAMAA